MSRLMLAMVGCLVVGAGGMWVASNFKVKFEVIGTPDHPPPPPVAQAPAPTLPPLAEPAKLPAHLLAQPTPGVVPASGSVPAVAVAATALGVGQDDSALKEKLTAARKAIEASPIEIIEVLDGSGADALLWRGSDLTSTIPLRNTSLTVKFRFVNSSPDFKAAVDGAGLTLKFYAQATGSNQPFQSTEALTATSSAVAINMNGVEFDGRREVKISARWERSDGKAPALDTAIRLPAQRDVREWPLFLPTGDAPTIVAVFNGRYSSAVTASAAQLFDGYARVQVRSRQPGARHEFFLYDGEPTNGRRLVATPVAVETRVTAADVTEYTLKWDAPTAAPGLLLVRESVGASRHQYVGRAVTVATLPALPAVTLANSDLGAKPKAGNAFMLNADKVNVAVSFAQLDGTVAPHARLLLFVNKDAGTIPAATQTATVLAADTTKTFSDVTFPNDGTHAVSVAFEAGGVVGPVLTVTVNVRRGGFAVSRVSPTDLSNTADNRIRVTFNPENKADPRTVTKSAFSLTLEDGSSATDLIASATPLDAAANSVTLQLTNPVPAGLYRLTVYGEDVVGTGSAQSPQRLGAKDVFGNALNNGQPSVFAITQPVGGAQPSVSVGVTPNLPPHVPLAEYLNPRPSVEGFNPSDRVESRVARLYYTRDAHLVVQTINRNAKSYNGASVDIRRRAADLARTDAEQSKTERQQYERAAVLSAQQSRAAETELKDVEARLQTARTQEATARTQITQRQQQADARRAFDQSSGGDARVQAQRDILSKIGTDLTGANRQLLADPTNAPLRDQRDTLQSRQEQEFRRLDALVQEGQSARRLDDEVVTLRQVQSTSAASVTQLTSRAADLRTSIQGLRAAEAQANEKAVSGERDEGLKRQDQFRREVAASTANPATVVVPDPNSVDPVAQCELTVIGEGLIQIRGPVKGLNIIRLMINQMDAPTGQVRVGVHTVQVNGERIDKMNKVVESIQRYIDHSRFLTGTSAQMLRNAVTSVASRKAVEAAQSLAPGCGQADRDQKYLYGFFGKDFIDELRTLDSEFLRTGNKVLSLHSMDSTSLASALFLMSLARNDVREEILREFQGQLQTKLPQAEWEKFVSGLSCPSKCEACFDRKFCMLSQNAKFPSFLGFFNSEVLGPDTLTPVQREFIRLAQIFKARMVTEIELKQRVMERTLLEQRIGNVQEEQRKAKADEAKALDDLSRFRRTAVTAGSEAQKAVAFMEGMLASVDESISNIEESILEIDLLPEIEKDNRVPKQKSGAPSNKQSPGEKQVYLPQRTQRNETVTFASAPDARQALENASAFLNQFVFLGPGNDGRLKSLTQLVKKATGKDQPGEKQTLSSAEYKQLRGDLAALQGIVREQAALARGALADMTRALREKSVSVFQLVGRYNALRDDILQKLKHGTELSDRIRDVFVSQANPAFLALSNAGAELAAGQQIAALSRRPLDEKKLIDMLVDDMEEKLIELLDGTRAHTANVDNYIKMLSSALDDDFTTQFYQPAFKKIRSLGGSWDVQFGQIESTTVLTNNRVLGKVSPTASMEFDLPKRDILLKEAFKGAKAAVQDYGALLNDPVFLSMVKMFSGSPVGATYGGFGGLPAVKNALPGLPGTADELIMAQSGAKRPEFGTYLEGLIADPSVYKFETGTGYEIRPVISPDGQAVVFGFDYMYTTDVREPVRADEKHLGRVKRHLLHTDVQLSNYELREVSKYWVSIKAARTGKGVSLLQDIPVAGALFRPAPSASSSLQQNLIYSQATIFPTLFDLMGLRYAPAVADLSPDGLTDDEFVVRGRQEYLRQYIFDYGASRVDDALRILYGERRPDLYRSQRSIPARHPNGYQGGGLRQRDAHLEEEYDPRLSYPPTKFTPGLRLPQRFDRDPFDSSEPPAGGPAIPPGTFVPGHPGPGLPGGMSSSRELPRTPLGTTVTRVPPTAPRPLVALPPIPMNGSLPKIPQSVPVIAPPPATPAQPSGVISRSQAPLDPAPTGHRLYPSDPVPLPRGSFFPR